MTQPQAIRRPGRSACRRRDPVPIFLPVGDNLFSRLKQARLVHVLAVYAGASWLILEATGVFIEQLGLPS